MNLNPSLLALVAGIILNYIQTGDVTIAEAADGWWTDVPPVRLEFEEYGPFDYQTTFWELRPRRLAPINTKTAVGIPGWPIIGFGYLMRVRYSEFELRFEMPGERFIHTLPHFKQVSPGEWLPGADTTWEKDGIRYSVTYICVPNSPQPVDLYRISVKNANEEPHQAQLRVTLNGAPTLAVDGAVINDRGKPLIVMDPPVPVERIMREVGVVDPRTTPAGSWRNGSPDVDEWATHRDGWYGMPIEYLLKAGSDQRLQVFLGFDGTPPASTPNWDVPLDQEYPQVVSLYSAPPREVISRVEGDEKPVRTSLPGTERVVLPFVGKDTDQDGYIKVSVRATPESRQPAVLSLLWAFDESAPITAEGLSTGRKDKKVARVSSEIYEANARGSNEDLVHPKYRIDVGEDLMWDVNREWQHSGNDTTIAALRLEYQPLLQAGEEKEYLLRLPAIDKPEAAPYGNNWRPYDTGESWKPYMDNRHPENTVPYGEDVPPGTDPAEYAAFGPKPRELWTQQLEAVRQLTWEAAFDRVKKYWEEFSSQCVRFKTPEPLLENLYKHQMAVLKMHRITFAPTDHEIQLTGPDWYWDIAISRDVPYMYYAWDWAGYPKDAESLWNSMLTPLSEMPRARWTVGQWGGGPETDGLWITRTGQFDGQGQILWGLTNHYFLTNDRAWLESNYPAIKKGGDWIVTNIALEKKRIGNPESVGYGMLPWCTPEGGGPGHNFYANSFGVLGLKSVARLADKMGDTESASRYRSEATGLQKALRRAIQYGFFRFTDFSGTIPFGPEWFPGPDLMKDSDGRKVCTVHPDTNFGCALTWPTEAVAPFDPLMHGWYVNREYQAEKSAGIFDWPYIAVDYGIGYIRRGEPDRAADWFYVYADNASGCLDWGEGVSVNTTFSEFDPPRQGIRAGGQMPHGWASAFYISYLRHLMLMEKGDELHIAPATPRKWLAQSERIGVEGAPSQFGNVTYHIAADPDQSTIRGEILLDPQRKPRRLLIHVRGPGGRGLESVELNGKEWNAYSGDTIVVPDPTEQVIFEAQYEE